MPKITTISIDGLLSEVEERLQKNSSASSPKVFPASVLSHAVTKPKTKAENLGVRKSQTKIALAGHQKTNTAGSDWFDLPKTNLTPEFRREWQLLRMRGLLDPKHQKKALRFNAPEYSQIGEVVAGPADFYSSRLTRKERKSTLLEEVIGAVDERKLQTKYEGIQRDKASGKRTFYKKLVSQRRRRQN